MANGRIGSSYGPGSVYERSSYPKRSTVPGQLNNEKKKLPADARINRAAAFGSTAKLYVASGQAGEASNFAKCAAHECSSKRMRKAITRTGTGTGEVVVRSYTRARPNR